MVWYGTLVPSDAQAYRSIHKKSPASDGLRSRRIERATPYSKFSLFFSSSSPSLPQLILPEIDRRRSKSTVPARQQRRQSKSIVTGRFQMVIGRKQPQSIVPSG
ncbi:hypothetical protein BHM03_00000525, partial [Ensete ventricosum]